MRAYIYTKYCVVVLLLGVTFLAHAEERPYLCEIGLQGGCSYYVGDATPHIFNDIRESYGLHFRYKFTKRWALQLKVGGQRIAGNDYSMKGEKLTTQWSNRLYNADMMAEFNFLRYGSANRYDKRIYPYTPYIFIGLGASLYNDIVPEGTTKLTGAGYLPLGIGFKWKFADFAGLNIAWQHNIYFADDIEGRKTLNDKYHMNGSNWLNCDLTGQLTLGIVFEFARAKRPCVICNY